MEKKDRTVIWTSELEDWPECEADVFEADALKEEEYQDLLDVFNGHLNGTIVVLKHTQFWNGIEFSVSVQGSLATNLFYRVLDSQEWVIEDNDLVAYFGHHDGTNRYIYRIFRGDEHDCEVILKDLFDTYHGEEEEIEKEILDETESLADVVLKSVEAGLLVDLE